MGKMIMTYLELLEYEKEKLVQAKEGIEYLIAENQRKIDRARTNN